GRAGGVAGAEQRGTARRSPRSARDRRGAGLLKRGSTDPPQQRKRAASEVIRKVLRRAAREHEPPVTMRAYGVAWVASASVRSASTATPPKGSSGSFDLHTYA